MVAKPIKSHIDSLVHLQQLFTSIAGNHWTWQPGKIASVLTGKNIRRQEDWPQLIAFFKERLVALDAFWGAIKEGIS